MGLIERWTLDMSDDDRQIIVGVREGHGHEPLGPGMRSVEVVPATTTPGAVTTLDAADSVARMLAEALRATRTDDEQTREALTMFDLYNAKRGR